MRSAMRTVGGKERSQQRLSPLTDGLQQLPLVWRVTCARVVYTGVGGVPELVLEDLNPSHHIPCRVSLVAGTL